MGVILETNLILIALEKLINLDTMTEEVTTNAGETKAHTEGEVVVQGG